MKIRQVIKSFGLRHQDKLKTDTIRFRKLVKDMNARSGYKFILQKRVVPGDRYTHWSIIREEYL